MAELLLPAGRLWRRLRGRLPAALVIAGVRRWPAPLSGRRCCLYLRQRWQPDPSALTEGWQLHGQRWQHCGQGLRCWFSRDGWRLYLYQQR